jgi:hypothetical protein
MRSTRVSIELRRSGLRSAVRLMSKRTSSLPFFDYVMERIDEGIVPRREAPASR